MSWTAPSKMTFHVFARRGAARGEPTPEKKLVATVEVHGDPSDPTIGDGVLDAVIRTLNGAERS